MSKTFVPADEPVTVRAAIPERGVRIKPPPPGFVLGPRNPDIEITGPYAGDYRFLSRGARRPASKPGHAVGQCDFCISGERHPQGTVL